MPELPGKDNDEGRDALPEEPAGERRASPPPVVPIPGTVPPLGGWPGGRPPSPPGATPATPAAPPPGGARLAPAGGPAVLVMLGVFLLVVVAVALIVVTGGGDGEDEAGAGQSPFGEDTMPSRPPDPTTTEPTEPIEPPATTDPPTTGEPPTTTLPGTPDASPEDVVTEFLTAWAEGNCEAMIGAQSIEALSEFDSPLQQLTLECFASGPGDVAVESTELLSEDPLEAQVQVTLTLDGGATEHVYELVKEAYISPNGDEWRINALQ